jgi:hypothetical protein
MGDKAQSTFSSGGSILSGGLGGFGGFGGSAWAEEKKTVSMTPRDQRKALILPFATLSTLVAASAFTHQ